MDPERWQQLGALFDTAVALPPTARQRFLDRACHGDGTMRRTLVRLLRADDAAGPLDQPVCRLAEALPATTPSPAPDSEAADRIGPYRLVRPLQQGGMGRVDLAVRDDDFYWRRVALKRLRPESAATAAGLHRELRTLARLEHPHIARLYDGGLDADGRPYLAMEYVEGEPITTYCDRRRLDVRARLRLLLPVCAAVAYAHRQQLVHCDLKPANILVGADGQPKVLDFGIAEELEGDEPMDAGDTPRPLTPAYASPEQLWGEAITPASDVYALGGLLHTLLAGRPPHATRGPGGRPASRQAPPLASTVGRDRRSTVIAQRRATTTAALRHQLRGDLDAIVAQALHPDPQQRYGTVEALAQDIRHHLTARPVQARRATRCYRARRFLRRHRLAVSAAIVITASLLIVVISSWRQVDHLARLRRSVGQTTHALVALLDAPSPAATGPPAPALLELALERTGFDTQGRPQLEAMVFHALGQAQLDAGLPGRAAPLLAHALTLRRQALGDGDHRDLAASLHGLGVVASTHGALQRGEDLLGEALAMRRRLYGAGHPLAAETLEALAHNRWQRLDLRGAESLMGQALAIRCAACGVSSLPVAESLSLLAALRRSRQALPEAAALAEEASILRRQLLEAGHPYLARSLDDLGDLAFARGAFDAAAARFREALAMRRAALGDQHMAVVGSLHNVARALGEQGHYTAARRLFRAALARHRTLAPGIGPDLATLLNNLAVVMGNDGDRAAAKALLHEVLTMRLRLLGPAHPHVAQTYYSLGWLLHDDGDPEAAASHYERASQIMECTLDPRHPAFSYPWVGMARLSLDRGETRRAATLLRRALPRLQASHSPGHWRIAHAEGLLGAALAAQGQTSEARRLLTGTIAVLEAQRGTHAPRTRRARERLRHVDAQPLRAQGTVGRGREG